MLLFSVLGVKKTRLSGGGSFVFRFILYIQFLPPCNSGIIISTTTIIITAATEMMLIIFLLNMKDVCYTNIHPPILKTKTSKISLKEFCFSIHYL